MPPHRRRPAPTASQAPPVRRPKVAGRHNPGQTGEMPVIRPDAPPPESTSATSDSPSGSPSDERDSVSGVLDGVLGAPPRKPAETDEPKPRRRPTAPPAISRRAAEEDRRAPADPAGEDDDRRRATTDRPATRRAPVSRRTPAVSRPPADDSDRPTPRRATSDEDGDRRPAGKRRSTGAARPEDLSAAETDAGADEPRARRIRVAAPRSKSSRQLSVAIVLAVVAVVLAGLAVFFRGQANDLTSGDTNTAMTDMGATTQVKSQLTEAINKTFSYNYTDLDSTAKAVQDRLSGKALCEYNRLFGQVKQLAPQQKIILNTEVRSLGVVRIDGDRAEALVYIDQVSTRADVNKTVAVRGQFAVQAHKSGNNWKITEFDMFGQPLFNGQPAPKC